MRRLLAVLAAVALVTTGFLVTPGIAQYGEEDGQGEDAQTQQQDGQQNQQNRSSDRGADQRPEQAMAAEDRRQWAQEKRQQALDRAERAGLFGELTYEDGQLQGTFVEATVGSGSGNVSNLTLLRNGTSVEILERFEPEDAAFGPNIAADPVHEEATVLPNTLRLPFEDGELRIQDNPTGQIHYRSTAPANVSVEVADGYDVSLNDNATKARILGDVNASVLLSGEGTLTEDGGTLEASLDEAGGVLFQAQPDSPGERVSQLALEHAAEQGKLGGEVRVAGAAGQPVNQSTPVDVNLTAQYASDGQAIVEIDDTEDVGEDEGRVVNLKIAKANLPVDDTDEVVPKLDREEIDLEGSIDDVVNATGDEPAAHVAVHNATVEVTIWVPAFSLHSVNVQDTTSDVTDIPEPVPATNPTGADTGIAQQAADRAGEQAQAWEQLDAETRAQATANAQQAGLFGEANLLAEALQGEHVQADVDADAGVLQGYSADGTTVFEEVRPAEFAPVDDPRELGPAVALVGEDLAVLAHDQPTTPLELKAGNSTTVEVQLATGAEVDRIDERRVQITTPDGTEAHLALAAGEGDLIVEGDTIVVNLGANATAQALTVPDEELPTQANLDERVQALADDQLGAEAAITAVEGTPVEDRVETSVELDTTEVDEAEGSVTVRASSQVPDPRAVTLNLDPELVNGTNAEELTVRIDGQEIQEAADAEAVLGSGEARSSFHVEEAGEGLQVLVNLEGFSEHDITVASDDTDDGTDDTNETDDTTDDGTDGTDDEQTEDAPFPSLAALLATVATLAVLRRP